MRSAYVHLNVLCVRTLSVLVIFVCTCMYECDREQERARDSWPGEESELKQNVL